ncbi:TlpA family protein disulfide reductase [candidate division KSB1 bacterium]|nr:MAG: TlpA family protein disulfide reductase [candidate division KSB1 bacterium]MBC6947385.1 TlpA family protein disulfide reductase [candidate division KSB1 bacterium]MCE7941341.1 TlpA family protein disulfide reductase [Chlorobi bacterium CHB1]MDL1873910.1 TlpA family protein disulfide reductase [Cytophagia bacterium CHB2]
MKAKNFRFAQILFAAILSLVCQQHTFPKTSFWWGTASLADDRQLPFHMFLDLTATPPSGYFLVGDERTPIPEITQRGDSLLLNFSEYGALMQARWQNGWLHGQYLRFREDTTSFTFVAGPATPEEAARAVKPSVPPVGAYRVYFEYDNGIDSASTATFWVKHDSIFGTILDPSGDYGLLAGVQDKNRVQLNRFTGWQALLVELEQTQGDWAGRLYVRSEKPSHFKLKPLRELPAPAHNPRQTRMKNPAAPFQFSGVTLAGDSLTSADPRLQGKVLLLDIMGSWCHNCMDAAPLLQQLYEEFHGDGLEVISLAFEIKGDFTAAQKNLGMFQQRYGLTFPIIFCGSTAKANVQVRLSNQLDDFFAYPTTIFVGRDGRVHAIHVGFHGPGTGERYQAQMRHYYETVKELLKDASRMQMHSSK